MHVVSNYLSFLRANKFLYIYGVISCLVSQIAIGLYFNQPYIFWHLVGLLLGFFIASILHFCFKGR